MSSNPIYDAIEEALLSYLEVRTKLPFEFDVFLPAEHVKWLIALRLKEDGDQNDRLIQQSARGIGLKIGGYSITIRRENETQVPLPTVYH